MQTLNSFFFLYLPVKMKAASPKIASRPVIFDLQKISIWFKLWYHAAKTINLKIPFFNKLSGKSDKYFENLCNKMINNQIFEF